MFFHKPNLERFASFWFLVSGKRVDLTLQDVLLGKLDAEVNLLNFFITLVKPHIWINRNHGVTPNLSAFKDIVKAKFRTEKYIATKNNTERNFQARWQLYINSLSMNLKTLILKRVGKVPVHVEKTGSCCT